MKIIINAEPNEMADVLALIMDKKEMFKGPPRLGWGWVFTIPNGRNFFLREITGGISASPAKER